MDFNTQELAVRYGSIDDILDLETPLDINAAKKIAMGYADSFLSLHDYNSLLEHIKKYDILFDRNDFTEIFFSMEKRILPDIGRFRSKREEIRNYVINHMDLNELKCYMKQLVRDKKYSRTLQLLEDSKDLIGSLPEKGKPFYEALFSLVIENYPGKNTKKLVSYLKNRSNLQ